jgi:cytochrome c
LSQARLNDFFLKTAVALVVAGSAAVAFAVDPAAVARGEVVFERHCAVCHSVAPNHHKEGPSLFGIFGQQAGTRPFFPRYVGLKNSTVVWNEKNLDKWLADPRAFLGGTDTSMVFKLADERQRADVIEFLKTVQ